MDSYTWTRQLKLATLCVDTGSSLDDETVMDNWQEDDILQKLRQGQTMRMSMHFLQMHLTKPKLYCIVWSQQQEEMTSTWTQIRKS